MATMSDLLAFISKRNGGAAASQFSGRATAAPAASYGSLKAAGKWNLSKPGGEAWGLLESKSGRASSSEEGIYNALLGSGAADGWSADKGDIVAFTKGNATRMLTEGGIDAGRAGEIIEKGFADSKRQQYERNKASHGGVAGAVQGFGHIAAKTAPIWGAALGGMYLTGTGAFGGAAASGGSASAGATAGGAAKATLMPAAIPESAATLSGWGMTQTAPGVFAGAGATGYVGASSAGVAASAKTAAAASGTSKTAAAAKGVLDTEILGTGITVGDVGTGLSAASSVMGLRAPSMSMEAEALPTRGEVSEPKKDPIQFATRRDSLARQAIAAGAVRGGNEADFLGSRHGTKRRGTARRSLIGY